MKTASQVDLAHLLDCSAWKEKILVSTKNRCVRRLICLQTAKSRVIHNLLETISGIHLIDEPLNAKDLFEVGPDLVTEGYARRLSVWTSFPDRNG